MGITLKTNSDAALIAAFINQSVRVPVYRGADVIGWRYSKLPEGVEAFSLDDPATLHNALARVFG